jgi:hypothetical protein
LVHFILALIWLLLAWLLVLWKNSRPGNPPENIDLLIGVAFIMALYKFFRGGFRWGFRKKPIQEKKEPEEQPPAPKVVNPEFDFSDDPEKK